MKKCPLCDKRYNDKEIQSLYDHIEEDHKDIIPKDWNGARYIFFVNHGRGSGKCRICGTETKWNDVTNKPFALCENPKCRKIYRQSFVDRMKKKYGKEHLLNDPMMQNKMLQNRSISGTYTWSDGSKVGYVGSYEKDFLQFLDVFLNFKSRDIHSPAPQIFDYTVELDGVKSKHFYIPDIYIESINTIVEIKDGGSNPNTHHKIVEIDKVKEKAKDNIMKTQKEFNYIKVTDKKYGSFLDFLLKLKLKDDYNNTKSKPSIIINEQLELLTENINSSYDTLYIVFYLNSGIIDVAFSIDIIGNEIYKYNAIEHKIESVIIDSECSLYMLNGRELNNKVYNEIAYLLGNPDSLIENKDNPNIQHDYIIDDSQFFIFNLINKQAGFDIINNDSNLFNSIDESRYFKHLYASKTGLYKFNLDDEVRKVAYKNIPLLESRFNEYINDMNLSILNESTTDIIYGDNLLKKFPMYDQQSIEDVISNFDSLDEDSKETTAVNIKNAINKFQLSENLLTESILSYIDEECIPIIYDDSNNQSQVTLKYSQNMKLRELDKLIENCNNKSNLKKDILHVILEDINSKNDIPDNIINEYKNKILK